MNAYIRKDKWGEFKRDYLNYNFSCAYAEKYYVKRLSLGMYLTIQKITRQLELATAFGGSPFMEVHNKYYQDLINDGFIEYKKGEFD